MNKIRKDIKSKKKQGGFTLIELVVAIGIMLIMAAVATPFLLRHIKKAKIASIQEQILNVSTAFNSYYTEKGGLLDDGGDGNYLDEAVYYKWLSKDPSGKYDLDWKIEKHTDGKKEAYYIKIENSSDNGYNFISNIAADLDTAIDGSDNGNDGSFQYNDDAANKKFTCYYLIISDPDMTAWH